MFHVEQNFNDSKFLDIFVEGASNLGFHFPAKTLEAFLLYYRELCQWEKFLNITSLRDEKEKIVLLFIDSLAGSFVFEGQDYKNKEIVDIGTGGGFPGIPLKIAFPEINLCLVEPRVKKTAFLVNLIGKLDLGNVNVIRERLENICQTYGNQKKWDMAMIKGVNINHVIPEMKKILNETGKLVVFRSKKFVNPGIIHDMKVCREIEYELPFGFGNRVISVLKFFTSIN